MNYYNDSDPKVCAWAKELIRAGLVPAGEVDCRPIEQVTARDLRGFTQCHFFCGILGWPLALRLVGWPEDEPVWTASLPCQPFSAAGKQLGYDDPRHLFPVFRRLVAECAPPVAFGEQVASKAGREWLAGVRADLEALGYAVGAADLCASGTGAPHIRQRLFWVADSQHSERRAELQEHSDPCRRDGSGGSSTTGRVADMQQQQQGLEGHTGNGHNGHEPGRDGADATRSITTCGSAGRVDHAPGNGAERGDETQPGSYGANNRLSRQTSSWGDFDIIPCRDGKARRIESGTFPLALGIPGRMGLLRGYGNAIVPALAAEFIGAYLDTRADDGRLLR